MNGVAAAGKTVSFVVAKDPSQATPPEAAATATEAPAFVTAAGCHATEGQVVACAAVGGRCHILGAGDPAEEDAELRVNSSALPDGAAVDCVAWSREGHLLTLGDSLGRLHFALPDGSLVHHQRIAQPAPPGERAVLAMEFLASARAGGLEAVVLLTRDRRLFFVDGVDTRRLRDVAAAGDQAAAKALAASLSIEIISLAAYFAPSPGSGDAPMTPTSQQVALVSLGEAGPGGVHRLALGTTTLGLWEVSGAAGEAALPGNAGGDGRHPSTEGRPVFRCETSTTCESPIVKLRHLPGTHGSWLASRHAHGSLGLWDAKTLESVCTWRPDGGRVLDMEAACHVPSPFGVGLLALLRDDATDQTRLAFLHLLCHGAPREIASLPATGACLTAARAGIVLASASGAALWPADALQALATSLYDASPEAGVPQDFATLAAEMRLVARMPAEHMLADVAGFSSFEAVLDAARDVRARPGDTQAAVQCHLELSAAILAGLSNRGHDGAMPAATYYRRLAARELARAEDVLALHDAFQHLERRFGPFLGEDLALETRWARFRDVSDATSFRMLLDGGHAAVACEFWRRRHVEAAERSASQRPVKGRRGLDSGSTLAALEASPVATAADALLPFLREDFFATLGGDDLARACAWVADRARAHAAAGDLCAALDLVDASLDGARRVASHGAAALRPPSTWGRGGVSRETPSGPSRDEGMWRLEGSDLWRLQRSLSELATLRETCGMDLTLPDYEAGDAAAACATLLRRVEDPRLLAGVVEAQLRRAAAFLRQDTDALLLAFVRRCASRVVARRGCAAEELGAAAAVCIAPSRPLLRCRAALAMLHAGAAVLSSDAHEALGPGCRDEIPELMGSVGPAAGGEAPSLAAEPAEPPSGALKDLATAAASWAAGTPLEMEVSEAARLLQLQHLALDYGVVDFSPSKPAHATRLWDHLLSRVDRATALKDALSLADAYTHLRPRTARVTFLTNLAALPSPGEAAAAAAPRRARLAARILADLPLADAKDVGAEAMLFCLRSLEDLEMDAEDLRRPLGALAAPEDEAEAMSCAAVAEAIGAALQAASAADGDQRAAGPAEATRVAVNLLSDPVAGLGPLRRLRGLQSDFGVYVSVSSLRDPTRCEALLRRHLHLAAPEPGQPAAPLALRRLQHFSELLAVPWPSALALAANNAATAGNLATADWMSSILLHGGGSGGVAVSGGPEASASEDQTERCGAPQPRPVARSLGPDTAQALRSVAIGLVGFAGGALRCESDGDLETGSGAAPALALALRLLRHATAAAPPPELSEMVVELRGALLVGEILRRCDLSDEDLLRTRAMDPLGGMTGESDFAVDPPPVLCPDWYTSDGLILPLADTMLATLPFVARELAATRGLLQGPNVSLPSPAAAQKLAKVLLAYGARQLALRVFCGALRPPSAQGAKGDVNAVLSALCHQTVRRRRMDTALAAGYLLALPPEEALTLFRGSLASCGSDFQRLRRLAGVGGATGAAWDTPHFLRQCQLLETHASWWVRLEELQVAFDHRRFQGDDADVATYVTSLIPPLLRATSGDVRLAQNLARQYQVDTAEVCAAELQRLLASGPMLQRGGAFRQGLQRLCADVPVPRLAVALRDALGIRVDDATDGRGLREASPLQSQTPETRVGFTARTSPAPPAVTFDLDGSVGPTEYDTWEVAAELHLSQCGEIMGVDERDGVARRRAAVQTLRRFVVADKPATRLPLHDLFANPWATLAPALSPEALPRLKGLARPLGVPPEAFHEHLVKKLCGGAGTWRQPAWTIVQEQLEQCGPETRVSLALWIADAASAALASALASASASPSAPGTLSPIFLSASATRLKALHAAVVAHPVPVPAKLQQRLLAAHHAQWIAPLGDDFVSSLQPLMGKPHQLVPRILELCAAIAADAEASGAFGGDGRPYAFREEAAKAHHVCEAIARRSDIDLEDIRGQLARKWLRKVAPMQETKRGVFEHTAAEEALQDDAAAALKVAFVLTATREAEEAREREEDTLDDEAETEASASPSQVDTTLEVLPGLAEFRQDADRSSLDYLPFAAALPPRPPLADRIHFLLSIALHDPSLTAAEASPGSPGSLELALSSAATASAPAAPLSFRLRRRAVRALAVLLPPTGLLRASNVAGLPNLHRFAAALDLAVEYEALRLPQTSDSWELLLGDEAPPMRVGTQLAGAVWREYRAGQGDARMLQLVAELLLFGGDSGDGPEAWGNVASALRLWAALLQEMRDQQLHRQLLQILARLQEHPPVALLCRVARRTTFTARGEVAVTLQGLRLRASDCRTFLTALGAAYEDALVEPLHRLGDRLASAREAKGVAQDFGLKAVKGAGLALAAIAPENVDPNVGYAAGRDATDAGDGDLEGMVDLEWEDVESVVGQCAALASRCALRNPGDFVRGCLTEEVGNAVQRLRLASFAPLVRRLTGHGGA